MTLQNLSNQLLLLGNGLKVNGSGKGKCNDGCSYENELSPMSSVLLAAAAFGKGAG